MIAVQIADIGSFMTKFLRSEIFDPFEFMEGTLQTRITYDFDGHILMKGHSFHRTLRMRSVAFY